MKTKLRLITGLAAVAVMTGAITGVQANTKQLSSVPRLELPATAANLVLKAQGEDRAAQTEAIVNASLDLSPDAAPTLVNAIAKLSPDMAPVAAAAAAAKLPKQTALIAKAATAGAPAKATEIVRAMCKKLPAEFATIAGAVAEAVQGMDRAILSSVVEALPSLNPFFVRAAELLAEEGAPVVARYVEQMSRDIESSAKALKTSEQTLVLAGLTPAQQTLLPSPPAVTVPVVRPAFQPIPPGPTEINRNQTADIPVPGGTRYSSP